MIKVFELLNRRADMTHAESMAYWTATHAPLGKSIPEVVPFLRRYNNNVGVPTGWGATEASLLPYDGVVELWLDIDADAMTLSVANPEHPAVVDEPNFLSTRPTPLIVEPVEVKPFSAPFQTKVFQFWKPHPSLTLAQAERIWLDEHLPAEAAAWGEALRGLVANCCKSARWSFWGAEMPPYAGVAEYYLDIAPADLPQRWAELASRVSGTLSRFAGDLRLLQVSEVVQVGSGPGPNPG